MGKIVKWALIFGFLTVLVTAPLVLSGALLAVLELLRDVGTGAITFLTDVVEGGSNLLNGG